MTLATGSGESFHDGISFNAATGRVVVKASGASPQIGTLASFFTFTGGNQSMFMGPNGLLVQAVTNTPRIEYDTNGNCLGLLMEASRTNLCLQSQDLATTWTLSTATVSANSISAPDGTTTADTLVEDATAATIHQIAQPISFAATTPYTFSVWAKAKERTWLELRYSAGFGSIVLAYFNVSTGVVGTTSGAPTTSITSYANGWYRIRMTATSGAAPAGGQAVIRLANADGGETYNGDNASGLYLWGAQVEAGAFPSSYIPTTTVSVARTADSCIRTLGSEFSATAGTVVVAGRASGGQQASNQFVWALDDNTFNESIRLTRFTNSDTARWLVVDGGVGQVTLDETFVNSTAFKHACAFALNDSAESFNGGAAQTDLAGTLPTVNSLWLGMAASGGQMNGHILRFDYYPTRLPNNMLQQMSA